MAQKFYTTWFYSPRAPSDQRDPEHSVNFDDFAARIQKIYDDFDSNGYDVVNVIPMAMGFAKTYAQTVAFTATRGAVVVGKLRGT
jgi:hypothetical protein